MKTQILKFTVILFITLFATSCSNNDDNPTPTAPTQDYFLRAKIDGVQYETDAPFRVLAGRAVNDITVTSTLADGRNFELKIIDAIGVGTYTYPVPAGSDYLISMEYGDATSATALWRTGACSATTGTLVITALSATEISGTFSFAGKRTSFCSDPAKMITEASFKSGIIVD